jgi:hypothetical protein
MNDWLEKMFRRCPSCKKLFEAVEVKKEVLGANEFEEGTRHGIRIGHVENVRVTFKCKNCDHEWTDIEQITL